MVDGGEIPEMAKTRAAISLQPVDLGGDPAHRPAIVEGEPQGGLGMGEIGIAAPVELLEPLEIERGGIARNPAVKLARQPDELFQRSAAIDRPDLNRMWQGVLR